MTTALQTTTLEREVARRRTFAIISHPDAGKTTLTEKFLLYGGAVEEAGSVRARRNARRSRSDWMAMERERGISITSTVLQFDAFGSRFNLLDTPGHEDFSEDTYRTLAAADSAVMVIDAARGIESQTRKLFAVCRAAGIPILTFINKMDHASRDPLELLDEIESVLGLHAVPRNWPVGDGPTFQGVYDLTTSSVLRFDRTEGGRFRAPVAVGGVDDASLSAVLGDHGHAQLKDHIDLLSGAGAEFDRASFLAGEMTPVYFGSALNNFGVEPFLEAIHELAPAPGSRVAGDRIVSPTSEEFSGFVFKIQANMDPLHRDRMAFLRICSGRFEKDMTVFHPRLNRTIRVARPHRLFAQERETVDEAFAGDIVGLVNPGLFAIGDTISSDRSIRFDAIPRFEPECFATIEPVTVAKSKQFHRGLEQLEEEGAVRVLYPIVGPRSTPVLAAVGALQFDVVSARLNAEYGVETRLQTLAHVGARRVVANSTEGVKWPRSAIVARDRQERLAVVFASQWEADYFARENPAVEVVALD